MNGAESLLETLVGSGVEVCFTNPGTSEMHFVAALDRQDGMRAVLGLFEGVVTGAADGYARMAGKPACTLLHLGPGLANGLANLHNARRARSPVVNVVGEHATYRIEAVDGGVGGGPAGDSFAFTVFFDPDEAPLNHDIFGPEFTFTGAMTGSPQPYDAWLPRLVLEITAGPTRATVLGDSALHISGDAECLGALASFFEVPATARPGFLGRQHEAAQAGGGDVGKPREVEHDALAVRHGLGEVGLEAGAEGFAVVVVQPSLWGDHHGVGIRPGFEFHLIVSGALHRYSRMPAE